MIDFGFHQLQYEREQRFPKYRSPLLMDRRANIWGKQCSLQPGEGDMSDFPARINTLRAQCAEYGRPIRVPSCTSLVISPSLLKLSSIPSLRSSCECSISAGTLLLSWSVMSTAFMPRLTVSFSLTHVNIGRWRVSQGHSVLRIQRPHRFGPSCIPLPLLLHHRTSTSCRCKIVEQQNNRFIIVGSDC